MIEHPVKLEANRTHVKCQLCAMTARERERENASEIEEACGDKWMKSLDKSITL